MDLRSHPRATACLGGACWRTSHGPLEVDCDFWAFLSRASVFETILLDFHPKWSVLPHMIPPTLYDENMMHWRCTGVHACGDGVLLVVVSVAFVQVK
jgi:hypothetical protein